jgi:hypothetical protein
MTTKERLHRLIDELPESELEPVEEILASRANNPDDPEAVRPGDVVDEWGNLSALRRASSPGKLGRLDREEIAAHGETISEAFARAERENAR